MHNLEIGEIEGLLKRYKKYLEDWASDYGEPGYTLSENSRGILFANWNNIPQYILNAFEKQFDLEWSDEWIQACETGKAYRSSPDSYGWKPYYVISDESTVWGGDEIEEDPEWYVNKYLLNDAGKVCFFSIDLKSFGFLLVDDIFETGLHPHQTDDPVKILKSAQEKFPDCDFVFSDYSCGQFDTKYSLYRRDKPKEGCRERPERAIPQTV